MIQQLSSWHVIIGTPIGVQKKEERERWTEISRSSEEGSWGVLMLFFLFSPSSSSSFSHSSPSSSSPSSSSPAFVRPFVRPALVEKIFNLVLNRARFDSELFFLSKILTKRMKIFLFFSSLFSDAISLFLFSLFLSWSFLLIKFFFSFYLRICLRNIHIYQWTYSEFCWVSNVKCKWNSESISDRNVNGSGKKDVGERYLANFLLSTCHSHSSGTVRTGWTSKQCASSDH